VLPWLDGLSERPDVIEHVSVKRVIDPASFPTIADKSGFFKNTQVKRQARLSRLERRLELAHAPLPVRQ
jgi:hypothetical protein